MRHRHHVHKKSYLNFFKGFIFSITLLTSFITIQASIAVLSFTGTFSKDLHLQPSAPKIAQNLTLGVALGMIRDNDQNVDSDYHRNPIPHHLERVVIENFSKAEPIYYRISAYDDLNDAIGNLRRSEGYDNKKYIGYINLNSGNSRYKSSKIKESIKLWANANSFSAVIWVDATSNIREIEEHPTRAIIEPLLASDNELLKNTQTYIKKYIPELNRTNLEKDILRQSPMIIHPNINNMREISEIVNERTDNRLNQTIKNPSEWYGGENRMEWGPFALFKERVSIPSYLTTSAEKRDWLEHLVIAFALHYEGLQYKGPWPTHLRGGRPDPFAQHPRLVPQHKDRRGHFPGRGFGLDCSNFIAWIYGLMGIQIDSDITTLMYYVNHPPIRHNLKYGTVIWSRNRDNITSAQIKEKLRPGDLIIYNGEVGHVMIYAGKGQLVNKSPNNNGYYIDSTSSVKTGVGVRSYDGPNNWAELINRRGKLHNRFIGVIRPIDLFL